VDPCNFTVPYLDCNFTKIKKLLLNFGAMTVMHQVFDNGMLQWSVIYETNHAILTVEPNTIPDQGSTLLLLTLGLLGLVTFRRRFVT